MALRQAARQLLGSCPSSLAASNGGALQARARALPLRAPSRFLGQLRPFNATAAARGGAGLPVEKGPPETREIPEHDELRWDDGSKHPEMILDDPAPQLSPGQGAMWLGMGLSVFGVVAFAAKLNDKASSVPFAPKEMPWDDLRLERGLGPKAA